VLEQVIQNNDVYAIVDKTTQRVIESLGLHDRADDAAGQQIGYVLAKTHWNQGYMTEAVLRVINHAFGLFDLWTFRGKRRVTRRGRKNGISV